MLRTTKAGLDLLSVFEDTRLKGYVCPAGVATIGRGLTTPALRAAGLTITYLDAPPSGSVLVGRSIAPAEEKRLFAAVVDHFENDVERRIAKVKDAAPHEFDAMVSLAWNIGLGNFANSSVLRLYLRGDRRGAAEAFAAWNKATVNGRKVVLRGLVRRRSAERALFLGDYEAASALAGTSLGPMPQRVAVPEKREPMLKSVSGNAQIGIGGAGILLGVETAREAVNTAGEMRETALSAGGLFGLSGNQAVMIGACIIIVGLAGWTWWRRRQRAAVEDRIDLTDPVDVAELSAAEAAA